MYRKPIAVKCRISRGGFSGERIIKVDLIDGSEHVGLAPTHYCWGAEGKPLGQDDPPIGDSTDGIVAAQELGRSAGGVRVTTPDGEVFAVPLGSVVARPRPETETHVSVGS
jgi:hypothetical protein